MQDEKPLETDHATSADAATAFVVDLDGTLSVTDTLEEGLLALAGSDPAALPHVLMGVREGRATLKARLADRLVISGDGLPLDQTVIDRVRAARDAGRETALVTAADQRQADAVAAALPDLFDRVVGSTPERNLKGAEKARFLTETYGEKGFDYAGDSAADLPVWAAARRAITVRAPERLVSAAKDTGAEVETLVPQTGLLGPLIKAMRPYQWSKNVLVFVPVLAAHDTAAVMLAIFAFIAFSLTASSVYLLNDLLDLAADRAHPRKRLRPFAAGLLSLRTGFLASLGLLVVAALIGGVFVGLPFLGVLTVYFIATTLYSFYLKRKLIIDVITLAGLYTIRIIAGAVAASIVLSPWLLGFSMFIFLALAAIKRQAELTDQIATGRESSGRAYAADDLPVLRGIALAASHAAILVLALYVSSPDVSLLYGRPEVLLLVCPLLLYWCLRMVMKTHRGDMTDDPIVFAARDRVSIGVILTVIGIVLAAV